jgi:fatty acid desaturase
MRADGLPRQRYRPRLHVEVASQLGLALAFAAGLWCVAVPRAAWVTALGAVLLVSVAVQAVLLFHDCMHQAAFGDRRVETWVARAIGAFYGCPFHFLRAEHIRHHRHAGLVDGDPEALHLHEADAARRPHGRLLARLGRRWTGAFAYTWILQLGSFARFARRQLQRVDDPALVRATLVDLGCMVALWVPLTLFLAAHGAYLRVLVFAFAIPAVVGLALVYAAAKPLHTLMIPYRLERSSYAERQLCVTRTFETHPLVAFFLCNLNYHIEHHLYPHVSRWDLPRLARALRPSLVELARAKNLPLAVHDGYTSFARASTPTYNPIGDLAAWGEENRGFRYTHFHAPRGP